MTELEVAEQGIASAVRSTLDALPAHPADGAARRLVESYARQLDRAGASAAAAARALRKAGNDAELAEEIAALRARLSERVAWETLGPKLLAGLVELGATPKARAAAAQRAPSKPEAPVGRLAAMRAAQ